MSDKTEQGHSAINKLLARSAGKGLIEALAGAAGWCFLLCPTYSVFTSVWVAWSTSLV
jgi:hypothetical protein